MLLPGLASGTTSRRRVACIALVLAACSLHAPATVRAQTLPVESPAEGLIESGAPAFTVSGVHSLGLTAAPRSLRRLGDGRLLVVGHGELALGDGTRWEVFQPDDRNGIVDMESVAVDPSGTIYVGVRGGFARVILGDSGRWTLEKVAALPEELAASGTAMTRVEMLGDVWLWTATSGPIVQWQPGSAARVVGYANAVERFFEYTGEVRFSDGSTGEQFRLEGGQFVPVARPAGSFVDDSVTSTVRLWDGSWLAGTIGRGLVRVDATGATTPYVRHGLTSGAHRINDLVALPGGWIAVAIDNVGVAFLDRDGRIVQVLDRMVDHRFARVRRLSTAPGGTVWLELGESIARVRFPSRVSHFEPLVPTALAFAQPFRHDGRLWLMSDGKAQRAVYDADGRLVRFAVDSPPGYLASLAPIAGRWFGATSEGLWTWDRDDVWSHVVPAIHSAYFRHEPPGASAWLYVAQDEVGWLRQIDGRFQADRFAVPGMGHAYGAVADRAGVLWAELGVGRVARIEPTQPRPYVEVYGPDDGLHQGWAQVIMIEGEARVSIPPAVLRFDSAARRWVPDTALTARMPGLAAAVGRPVIDARGRLWVPAGDGTRVGPPEEPGTIDPSIPGELRPVHVTPQGDGVMWLHQPRRLSRYDPDMPEPEVPPLHALITRVEYSGSGRTVHMPGERLPDAGADDNALIIHFLAPDALLGRPVTFNVVLEGAGRTDVVPTGSGGQVTFSRLDAGEYRLRVRPSAGGVEGTDATLAFTVLAPWYRTRAAYTWYAITTVVLLAVLGWMPAWLERRENHRLELLVAERTGELNRANRELAEQFAREREEQARRLRLEAELFQAQKLESLGTLAGGIAHDFNNILTGILGCCELATLSAREGHSVVGDLAEIRAAGLRAKDLVSRMLTFSRRNEPKLAPLDLATAVGDALKLVRASTPSLIEIKAALSPGMVRADATQMHQVVVNLCTNAVHAMLPGPGILEVRVDVMEAADDAGRKTPGLPAGPCLCLSVTDTGHGMDAATQARIFDPFFTTKGPGAGTGLGLSIVRGILENHGASLRVHSEPGRGTRVEVYVPVTSEAAPVEPRSPTPPGPGGGREVMVVDDEPAVARFIAAYLRQLDYRPQVFLDPLAARDAFAREPARYPALVTDLTMPHLSGKSLIEALRRLAPNLPVVVVSGFNKEMAGFEQSDDPRLAVLTKPFSGDDLGHALARVLAAEPKPRRD